MNITREPFDIVRLRTVFLQLHWRLMARVVYVLIQICTVEPHYIFHAVSPWHILRK